MYVLGDCFSMDQVPLQDRGAKTTVEYKGKKSVHKNHKKLKKSRVAKRKANIYARNQKRFKTTDN